VSDHKALLREALLVLGQHISGSRIELETYQARAGNSIKEDALMHCLGRAKDLAEATVHAGEYGLEVSLATLQRALLETMFWTVWVHQSDENAQEYKEITTNELARLARKTINAGIAKVYDKKSGTELTDFFLKEVVPQYPIHRRKSIMEIAKEGGLEDLYTWAYSFGSIPAHGADYGFSKWTKAHSEEKLFAGVAFCNATMNGIRSVVRRWMTGNEIMGGPAIMKLLDPGA